MIRGFAHNLLARHPGTILFCHLLRLPLVITFNLVQRKQAQEDTGWAEPVSWSSIPDQGLECGRGIKTLGLCVSRSHQGESIIQYF